MENSVPYSSIKDINLMVGWDGGHRHCLRIVVTDGSILLQVRKPVETSKLQHLEAWHLAPAKNKVCHLQHGRFQDKCFGKVPGSLFCCCGPSAH
jgi:hypothetical protein